MFEPFLLFSVVTFLRFLPFIFFFCFGVHLDSRVADWKPIPLLRPQYDHPDVCHRNRHQVSWQRQWPHACFTRHGWSCPPVGGYGTFSNNQFCLGWRSISPLPLPFTARYFRHVGEQVCTRSSNLLDFSCGRVPGECLNTAPILVMRVPQQSFFTMTRVCNANHT